MAEIQEKNVFIAKNLKIISQESLKQLAIQFENLALQTLCTQIISLHFMRELNSSVD